MKRKPKKVNPVAKHTRQFNRAAVFRDRSKYQRNVKHKAREPFAIAA